MITDSVTSLVRALLEGPELGKPDPCPPATPTPPEPGAGLNVVFVVERKTLVHWCTMPEGLYRYRCECKNSNCDREMILSRRDWERLAELGQVVHRDHAQGRRIKLRILDARAVGTSWGVGGKPL